MAVIDDFIAMLIDDASPCVIHVSDVRDQLRDYPEFNEIVRKEAEDEEYAKAIIKVMASFNAMSPFDSGYGPKDFPDRSLLMDWSAAQVLRQVYTWHARNQWSASDAGLQVPLHEQWEGLQRIAEGLMAEAKQTARELKTRLNIKRGFGRGVNSALWWR
jgi:hypothetical protein